MSMIKKILAAALAVLMLVAMTACGKECDYCGKSIKGEAAPKEISFQKYIHRCPSDHYPVVIKVDFSKK